MSERVITRLADLPSVADEWREIERDTAWPSVFATFAFVTHWYECFASPNDVRVVRVTDAGRTIGFLPLVLDRAGGTRVLRSISNLHCMHSTPAIRRGCESAFPRAAVAALVAAGGWDVLDDEYAYSFLPARGFDRESALAGGLRVREDVVDAYCAALPSSFDEYFASLSANSKKNYKRLGNRLDKAGANRLLVFHGRDAIAEWPDLVRIENAGWKGEARSSLQHLDDAYRRYYRGLLDLLAARDELSVYFLELNGTRVAGAFGYVEGDVFHWFKTGYDEAFAEFAPSNLLIVRIIEHLIASDPRVRRFHMFPVDYGYKHRYANETPPSTMTRTLVYNTTLRGRLAYARVVARESLRRMTLLRRVVRVIRRSGSSPD